MGERRDGKILVMSSREICYRSSNFFANQIGAAFEELGYEVEVCEMGEGDDLDAVLEPLLGVPYRLILDFNSMLPRLELEDGTPFLDRLDGPFYDYIVDHPLFHYNCLTSAAQNIHVLVLDEAQGAYVSRYYPGVKSVHVLPLAATQSLFDAERMKSNGHGCGTAEDGGCEILLPGTYDSPDAVYGLVEAAPQPLCDTMKKLIERRIAEPLISMEQAYREYLEDRDEVMPDAQFALFMNAMYAVDAYIRDYFRKEVLDALLDHNIPVTVMGEGWEKYHHPGERLLSRKKAVPFSLSFEHIAKADVLLNVSPIFAHGMHDRIPAGMANHTVVLTDVNPYLERHFTDGEDIAFYSLEHMESLSEKADFLCHDRAARERIQEAAYRKFEREHTWTARAERLLEIAAEEGMQ